MSWAIKSHLIHVFFDGINNILSNNIDINNTKERDNVWGYKYLTSTQMIVRVNDMELDLQYFLNLCSFDNVIYLAKLHSLSNPPLCDITAWSILFPIYILFWLIMYSYLLLDTHPRWNYQWCWFFLQHFTSNSYPRNIREPIK